jgi:hypothetical protein
MQPFSGSLTYSQHAQAMNEFFFSALSFFGLLSLAAAYQLVVTNE